jgi:hypothetical protein
MKKVTRRNSNSKDTDILPEYDFSGGVRGKHYRAMQSGYTVTIHKADGAKVVKHYKPAKGTIVLAPDVRKYFPTSDIVNRTLRSFIPPAVKSKRATPLVSSKKVSRLSAKSRLKGRE